MAIISALLQQGYSLTLQPLVERDIRYEVALTGLGVAVLPARPADKWDLRAGSTCIHDVIYIARRLVFGRAIGKVKADCPDAPVIFDTGEPLIDLSAFF